MFTASKAAAKALSLGGCAMRAQHLSGTVLYCTIMAAIWAL